MTLHAFPFHRNDPLKIGFLTPHNALDRHAFSGTPFHAACALKKRDDIQVHLIGRHRAPGRFERIVHRKPTGITFEATELDGLDLVIGMVATPLLDQLRTQRPNLPYLHVTDATPAFLRDVYGWSVPREADAMERQVARAAAACVYSSAYIAQRAGTDLGIPGFAPKALPFGANFETAPKIRTKPSVDTRIELLFVGIDWVRKGGDIAVAALDALRRQGREARLTIVGQCPERHRNHPAIRTLGFLNKNRARHAKKLSDVYNEAHLLILPTRADCTPMVIAEAMAHATPVLATDTGGIATQIGGQGAGRLLPLQASPENWARAIQSMTDTPDAYALLSDAALDRAQKVLSWSAWAEEIIRYAREITTEAQDQQRLAAIG